MFFSKMLLQLRRLVPAIKNPNSRRSQWLPSVLPQGKRRDRRPFAENISESEGNFSSLRMSVCRRLLETRAVCVFLRSLPSVGVCM